MCLNYYLSLPLGQLFAFSINTEETLGHLNSEDVADAQNNVSRKSRQLKKNALYMAYVTKITPDNIEFVILASEPNVAAPLFTSAYPPVAKLNTRQGISVQSPKKAPWGLPRIRTKTRINTLGRSEDVDMDHIPMTRSNCQQRLPPGIFTELVSSESTFLSTSDPLPWPRAYAYRPTLKHSHMHRFVVNSFSSEGAKRPGVRIPRREAEQSERVLNGLRAEEQEKWEENERSMRTFANFSQLSLNSDETEDTMNSLLSSAPPKSKSTITTYADIDADDALAHPFGLPISIDIFLDITKVKNLPTSPADFEDDIERIEEIERLCRRKFVQRMEEWRESIDINGFPGEGAIAHGFETYI